MIFKGKESFRTRNEQPISRTDCGQTDRHNFLAFWNQAEVRLNEKESLNFLRLNEQRNVK